MNETEFSQRFLLHQPALQEADYPLRSHGREAAVLIPLLKHDPLQLLLTTRANHLRHHPGQVSFPGGAQDAQDHDLIDTALRESLEEISLAPEHVSVLGQMPAFRTISGYRVTPVIGLVDINVSLEADHNEVEDVFTLPLAFALDRDNHHTEWVKRNGKASPVYFIRWQDKMIWGATAAFIRNLSYIIYPD